MRVLRALRALARVELRQLSRHRGRSLLVVLLVAVPVAALVGGSAVVSITTRTSAEWKATALGAAPLRVDAGTAAELDAVAASLPAAARTARMHSGREEVRIPGRRLVARSFSFAFDALEPDGLACGLLRTTVGRAPRADYEVALSPAVLEGLGLALGDSVALATGAATVVGEVVDPESLGLPVVLRVESPDSPGAPALLIDVPDAAQVAAQLRSKQLRVTTREDLPDSDPFEALLTFVFGSFGFFEAALVIAAAFAVGLRRRQREIGLVGSIGATSGAVRFGVAISAAVLASIGAVLGALVGAGVAWLAHPYLDPWNGRLNGPFELSGPHILGAFALGIVTAVGASAWPARTAARLPIRVALSGRRPPPAHSGRWLGIGLAMVFGGFGCMLAGGAGSGVVAGTALLVGSMLAVLGLGVASPWILQRCAELGGRLPIAWRLAVRDAGRFRARNGPVVTAVLAGLSIGLWLAAFVASIEDAVEREPALRDDIVLVEGAEAEEVSAELLRELDGVATAPLRALHVDGRLAEVHVARAGDEFDDSARWVACGGGELLQVVDAGGRAAELDAGRVIVLDEAVESLDAVSVRVGADPAMEVAAVVHEPTQRVRGPRFVIDPDAEPRPGWQAGPPPGAVLVPWLVRFDRAVDRDLLEQARAIAARSAATTIDAEILHTSSPRAFLFVVVLVCLLTGLVVIFVATALSSVESAADAHTLNTVGASPAVLRDHVAARAGYLALLGGCLAVPGGLLPALGLLPLSNLPLEFVWPWREMVLAVVAFPLLAYAGTWLFIAARGRRVHLRSTARA